MRWPRVSGILLHPTSLPGPYGIGDLGPEAIRFLGQLAAARQRVWQMLPLGPTGYGNSPYSALSAFAGNTLLISPDLLLADGLLPRDALTHAPAASTMRVDFPSVTRWKGEMLRQAYARFAAGAAGHLRAELDAFRQAHAGWLDDYCLYTALKEEHHGAGWTAWPRPLALREPDALAAARQRLATGIEAERFAQMLFFRQWHALRDEAHRREITLMGDVPIFVAPDSADVWARRDLFRLDAEGHPTVVAGVPPDYFSPTGQRWGNPLYDWAAMSRDGYAWWIARVRQASELVDALRLDHFRGFDAHWEIPASEPTAVHGSWQPGPGAALFTAIQDALGDLPFVAEDLGVITPSVRALRHDLGLPGTKVLQFGLDDGPESIHLPHHVSTRTAYYTGTHDNDTSRGWLDSLTPKQRLWALAYLDTPATDAPWAMIRAVMGSTARLAIFPLQDLLGLGSEARMNFPAKAEGNWEWRYTREQVPPDLAARLASLTEMFDRLDERRDPASRDEAAHGG
ncbi:MAG TPA: 4-alpha-glucanotransferase [Ktedonobacterales bacterium]